jgi:hypothetical protein
VSLFVFINAEEDLAWLLTWFASFSKVLLEDYMCSLFGSDTQLEHMDVHCGCFGKCRGRLQGAVLSKEEARTRCSGEGSALYYCTQNQRVLYALFGHEPELRKVLEELVYRSAASSLVCPSSSLHSVLLFSFPKRNAGSDHDFWCSAYLKAATANPMVCFRCLYSRKRK